MGPKKKGAPAPTPKKPATPKTPKTATDGDPDGEHDETDLFSASTMDALEIANTGLEIDEEERRLDEEIFGEDMDLVNDPTYVPPAPGTDPVAGPSGVAVNRAKANPYLLSHSLLHQ